MKRDEEAWVEVRNCSWVHEAQFVKSLLDSAGIEALIPDEYTLGVQPLYGPALGGVRVLVRADDFRRASELLDTNAGGETTHRASKKKSPHVSGKRHSR
jgi:hypothetical protein